MQKLLIAALFVLAVAAHFGEVEESGRLGDLLKKGAQKLAPHIKDIAREVAPVLKEAIKNKIKSEITKRLQLDEVEESQWQPTYGYRQRPRWNVTWDEMYRPRYNRTWDRPSVGLPYRPMRNRTWDRNWNLNNTNRWNLNRPSTNWNFVEEDVEESQWSPKYSDMRYRPRPRWNTTWDEMYRPMRNRTWDRPIGRPVRNRTWDRNWRLNNTNNRWNMGRPSNNWNFVEEDVEESQWSPNIRDMRYRPRPRWNTTWDEMYRPMRNRTWDRPIGMPYRNRTWDRNWRLNNTNRWNLNRPSSNWNFVEETEESQWAPIRDMRYRPRWNSSSWNTPRWNESRWDMRRPRVNTSWNRPTWENRWEVRPTWNNTWNRVPRRNNSRLNMTWRVDRPNKWNFVEETEESQWGEEFNNNWRNRRPMRNSSWGRGRRMNTTWDQMYRPSQEMRDWTRPRRNRTDRWANQTRRNRTGGFRRPPMNMNRWNFVEETEESQWGPRDWNNRYPTFNRTYPTYPGWVRPTRNSSWGMPTYDRPIYRPTPQWYNQTWRRPNWDIRFDEESEDSQFRGLGRIGAPTLRRNRTQEGREFRETRDKKNLRDKMMKDGKKGDKKKGDKKGDKKGENKGWWSKFSDRFRRNRTEEGKPMRPNKNVKPMRPGLRPRPRVNQTNTVLFL